MRYPEDYINKIIQGDCLKVMKDIPNDSIDTIITDPPYALGFMGKAWDKFPSDIGPKKPFANQSKENKLGGVPFQKWTENWATECLRVAKPGATLLCFGGTRTFHRMACGIEDSGWQIFDTIFWVYGSGFPKSLNISKAIDKRAGKEREVIGKKIDISSGKPMSSKQARAGSGKNINEGWDRPWRKDDNHCERMTELTVPHTPEAKLWDGWGTALKPAVEPIICARKPVVGSYAENALMFGVSGLNIDGGRIGTEEIKINGQGNDNLFHGNFSGKIDNPIHQGRFPANIILDEEAGRMLDEQSGISKSGFMSAGTKRLMSDNPNKNTYGEWKPDTVRNDTYGDMGGASRFFYCAKASKSERNMGCEGLEEGHWNDGRKTPKDYPSLRKDTPRINVHPTVKPLKLMEYLCILTRTPTGGIILDPFAGSGTTLLAAKKNGRDFIGIEIDSGYCEIARKRLGCIPEKLKRWA